MILPLFTWIIALIAISSLMQATVAAAEDGQLAFNNVCRTCHTLKEGDNRWSAPLEPGRIRRQF